MDMQKYQQMMQLQQNVEVLERYLQDIDQQTKNLEVIYESLDDFEKVKEEKEILVPIVNGIFFKAKLTDNSNFLINIGADGIVVEKSPAETKEMIKNQIDNMRENQIVLTNQLNTFVESLNNMNQE